MADRSAPQSFRRTPQRQPVAAPLVWAACAWLTASAAIAQDWDLGPTPGQNWLPDAVVFAGQDQFVWTSAGGAAPRHLLLRAHAEADGWIDRQETQRAGNALVRRIAGGARADRLFALEGLAGGTVQLHAYDPWNHTPGTPWSARWSTTVLAATSNGNPPAMQVACDRAGERVFSAVALDAAAGGGAQVSAWSAQDGTLLWTRPVVGTGLDALEVSADGQTIAVASGLHLTALGQNGQTITHHFVSASLGDVSLSDDGQVMAGATLGGTRVWQRDAAGFFEADWYTTHSGQAFESLSAEVDLSADGRVMAVAHWRYLGGTSTAFELWDTQKHQLLWQQVRPIANPARQDLPTQVEVHPSGAMAAFGAWSDEIWPEVVTARATDAGLATWQAMDHDLPGSVRDLRLSGDGERLAIAYKQGHAQAFGGVGAVRTLSLQTPELTWTSPARPGQACRLQAQRSDAWFTLFLIGPRAAQPTVVGGVAGTLLLDRAQLSVRAAINDASGRAQFDWVWPAGLGSPQADLSVQCAYRTPTGTVLGEALVAPLLLP